ncbi:MAG: glycosyltransferase [Albidovulum sp.]|uniref:glycosyltransferase n=1 Tax=Albidovulum sp. TaxID=1872424 RepID=UPI003C9AEF4E
MTNPADPVAVDICVCTFRRPQIADTLASIEKLAVPQGCTVSVIVADNDDTPSARPLVESWAQRSHFRVTYLHCPARNISIARNGCLDTCAWDYVAFLDDDEVATEEWLDQLLGTARTTGADVVLGPVEVRYRPGAPAWMQGGDLHDTRPVWVRGKIRTGYTCNVLFRRSSPAFSHARFDPGFGQSGGEDSDFFHRAFRNGARFVFAPDAILREEVPDERATFDWLARRRFRMGHTHGQLIARDKGLGGRFGSAALAGLKVIYCLAAAGLTAAAPRRRNHAALRGLLHIGTLCGLFGWGTPRHYGQPQSHRVLLSPLSTDIQE